MREQWPPGGLLGRRWMRAALSSSFPLLRVSSSLCASPASHPAGPAPRSSPDAELRAAAALLLRRGSGALRCVQVQLGFLSAVSCYTSFIHSQISKLCAITTTLLNQRNQNRSIFWMTGHTNSDGGLGLTGFCYSGPLNVVSGRTTDGSIDL